MPEATKVLLNEADRKKLKEFREAAELSQEATGLAAWPHMEPSGAKAAVSRLETNKERAVNVTTLVPLLDALGLQLSELKIRKATL